VAAGRGGGGAKSQVLRSVGFFKIQNYAIVIIREKMIHEKNLKRKISWDCPFNRSRFFNHFCQKYKGDTTQ
jgi:hypothetical protein